MEGKCKDYSCVWWTPWAHSCAICAMTNTLINLELRQDGEDKDSDKR